MSKKDAKKNNNRSTALAAPKPARNSSSTPLERQAAALRANAKAINKAPERAALNTAAARYEARAKVERKQ